MELRHCLSRASDHESLSLVRRPSVSISWGSRKTRSQASRPSKRKPGDEEIAASGLLMLASQDPWKIKKILTQSDLNAQSRLLIPTVLVVDHIIPHLDDCSRGKVHSEGGLNVRVKDCDTRDVFPAKLKWRSSSCSYVLMHGWRRDFADRRRLEKDQEIGLFWSRIDNMLAFSVLRESGV